MFIALILTVCTIADPQNCQEKEFTFESHGGIAQCMFEAQPWIAAWSSQNPKWQVKRWRCKFPGAEGQPT